MYGKGATGLLPMLVGALLMVSSVASAQAQQGEGTANSVLDTIPEEARAVFNRYVQKTDTATIAYINKHRRDKFIKRISFHTNMVDWATLVPNVGIEVDLKGTPRNNYSIALFGKFNGKSKHGKLVYNVNAVRVEGRKYWRTGKYGKKKDYYDSFEKLCTDTASIYFNADTLAGYSYYVDTLGRVAKAMGVQMTSIRATPDMTQEQVDSLDFAEDSLGMRKSRFRNWFYNTYNKVRRNVTSGRTLENPRNWRAYYIGLWVGFDNWSISLTGNGKQGKGVGAGAVLGYTLPLFPQKFPREGSLDLDFGMAVGWKAVNYVGYTYEPQTQHYVYNPEKSSMGWKIVPYPIIQDIHVSLVWRFRGIKSKVDRSLIDDYEQKWVAKYNQRRNDAENKQFNIKTQRDQILEKIQARTHVIADSTQLWDAFHRRRLEAARRLNPDTTFIGGKDQEAYLRIFHNLKTQAEQEKYIKTKKEEDERIARERAKQAERDSIQQVKQDRQAERDSIAQDKRARQALADSLKEARRDSIRMAKESKEMSDTIDAPNTDTPEVAPKEADETSPTETHKESDAEDGMSPESEGEDSDSPETEEESNESPAGLCALWAKKRLHGGLMC